MKGYPVTVCIVWQVCYWNTRESEGRFLFSQSLSLLEAICCSNEDSRLRRETCASGQVIRSEQRSAKLTWNLTKSTKQIWSFWRASADQQKWQSREAMEKTLSAKWLHQQQSQQWENSLDWQQISWSGKISSTALQVHMKTWRKLKHTAQPAGCSWGWAHCQTAVTGGSQPQ